jgi:hypothetical protein
MSTGINIGKSIKVLDEGSTLTSDVAQIDFTGSGVTATTSGNNVTVNVTGSSGVWGISNVSGVYTYYATLQLAINAATSGQVIEMFADVTDAAATTVTLKAGVIIQGNGHTYTHTSTTGNTFTTDLTSGTYTFLNMNIKRTVTTPTGAYIFANSANFYYVDNFVFRNTSVDYTWTTSVGNTPYFIGSTYAHTINIDGLRATSNGSGTMIYDSVLRISNSYLENTGTGSCYSSYNFTGGTTIENCYVKSVSGTAMFLNYPDSVIRNCTAISSTGVAMGGQSGATAYDSFAFSNTTAAFSGLVCYNCTGQTTTGYAFFACQGYNITGRSTTGYTIRPFSSMSNFYNSSFHSSGSIVCYDVDYGASFYNCSLVTGYNNAAGHAVSIGPSSGNPAFVNNYIQVANASANCIRGTNSFSAAITGNAYKSATTPVNANVTQTITNTKDNQGNILI